MPTVSLDPPGNIGRMSAPQRSAGRLAPRRPVPVNGIPGPEQSRLATCGHAPEAAGRPPHPFDGAAPAGVHPVELAGLLHELSVRLLAADDVPGAVGRLAAFVTRPVPDVLRCSVVLIGEGAPPTVAGSGRPAQALDDLQFAIGDGPGLEAARTCALVTVQDLPTDARWPGLADCAREHGVHSVAAIPLEVQRSSVGSLSIYVAAACGVDPGLLLTAMAIVGQAEVPLGEVQRRAGLRAGAAVDRAIGVIIAQRGCGVQEAYDVLRDTAQRLGMDHRAVAERLIAAAAARSAAS
jgi:ANTAR domain